MVQLSEEAQRLLGKFIKSWGQFTAATDSDARYEAQGDYREYAVDLALQLMGEALPPTKEMKPCPNCGGTRLTEAQAAGKLTYHHCFDCGADIYPPENGDAPKWFGGTFQVPAMWGISPDETDLDPQTHEVPDNTAATLTVRDIIDQIHTAARDHRLNVPGARDAHYILGYIQRKEQEASRIRGEASLKRVVTHIGAIRITTDVPSHRIHRIEKLAEKTLALPSEAVQS